MRCVSTGELEYRLRSCVTRQLMQEPREDASRGSCVLARIWGGSDLGRRRRRARRERRRAGYVPAGAVLGPETNGSRAGPVAARSGRRCSMSVFPTSVATARSLTGGRADRTERFPPAWLKRRRRDDARSSRSPASTSVAGLGRPHSQRASAACHRARVTAHPRHRLGQ